MCTGSIIHFWCPCTNPAADHYREPGDEFYSEAQGHKIVRSISAGTYFWCNKYFLSAAFKPFTRGVPGCPTRCIRDVHLHFRSTRLCDDCVRNGCVLRWETRGMYGRRTAEEKAQLDARAAAKREVEREAARIKAKMEMRHEQKWKEHARRYIESPGHMENTSWLGRLKSGLRQARINRLSGSPQSADSERDSSSQDGDQPATRKQQTHASSKCGVTGGITIGNEDHDLAKSDHPHSPHAITDTDSDLPVRPVSRASIASIASTITPATARRSSNIWTVVMRSRKNRLFGAGMGQVSER
ncbi:hypothetical protein MFIFM68171_05756 [Madurella fahalii]|uniref:Uncharacterized protein n=1 Tax=Madurella fahalii TaxID=1157608 RepID=A0ABQ0GCR1_9PEZI